MPRKGSGKSRFSDDARMNGGEATSPWTLLENNGRLEIHFRTANDHVPHCLGLTNWTKIGGIAPLLANAFASLHATSSKQTRRTASRSISDSFVPWLVDQKLSFSDRLELPRDLLTRYLSFLKERTNEDGTPYANSTRMHYWRYVATLIVKVASGQPTVEIDVPSRPFAGMNMAPTRTKRPDRDAIASTLLFAANAAIQTMDAVDSFLPGLHSAIERLDSGLSPNWESLEDLVAHLVDEYDGVLPPRKELVKLPIWSSIEAHGYTRIRRLINPVANDLMPFFLLMAAHSGWNQQPLAHLRLSNCVLRSLLGTERLTISAEKLRAGSIVRRSFALTGTRLSPHAIIEFITRWTSVLRANAPDPVRDDLWLHYVAAAGRNSYKRMHVDSLALRLRSAVLNPTAYVLRYCEENGLKFTGLQEMRLAFAERASEVTGGDMLALRVLLGHKDVSTTNTHYRTAEMQRRDAEALAGVQAARERWITSDGKVDHRRANSERAAATPGFTCLDPFDSPLFGQRKGRMCDAYGRCPTCPLAASDPDIGYALARFHQLKAAFEAARTTLGAAAWKIKFAKESEELSHRWIPRASSAEALERARQLLLPPLPEIE
ncbi:hypothetical protein [Pseudoxanthomonas suwonensis]|uniref:hypothetical protein n=1 Tax=Pseudoxanthomonas suwonensis TaxID=314722 RepID=UPI00138F2590|nr:hypothetical protein [Pseudoxanthomonas suwonensis]